MLGLLFTPLLVGYALINDILPVFEDESWELFTSPYGEFYHPDWEQVFVFELLGNVAMLVFSLVLLVMFFGKKRCFPGCYIFFLIANLLFLLIDHAIASQVLKEVFPYAEENPSEDRALVRSIFGALIWIPYILLSKRVKNTFVH